MTLPIPFRKSSCRPAFTLIELLVVVAILGILAAILVPSVGKMRAKGLETKCISNLRQVGLAATLYRTDSGGLFPRAFDAVTKPAPVPNKTWIEKLIPYVNAKDKDRVDPKSVFNCPSRKPLSGQAQWWKDGMSFGMNTQIEDANWAYRVAVIPEPSKIVWVAEIVETNGEWARTSDNQPNWGALMAFRHAPDKSNVLFCDGHAEPRSREDLVLVPANGPSLWKWW